MSTSETIKTQADIFVSQLEKIAELTDYNINLSIEPKKDKNFKPTGFMDSETIRSFRSEGTEYKNFSVARKTNGDAYYYRGKLTSKNEKWFTKEIESINKQMAILKQRLLTLETFQDLGVFPVYLCESQYSQ